MDNKEKAEAKSTVTDSRYFIFGLLFLYLIGCAILSLTLFFFKEWGLVERSANGLYYALDGSNADLIDFYNAFNMPRRTYFNLFKIHPFLTILLSLVLFAAFMRLTSSRDNAADKDIGTGEKKTEEPLSRPFCIDFIILDLPGSTKEDVFSWIAGFVRDKGLFKENQYLYDRFMEKERSGSTGIGCGIALPEVCFLDIPREYVLILCRLSSQVDFASIDGAPVSILLVFLSREKNEISRLAPVMRLVDILKSDKYRQALMSAKTEREFCQVLEAGRAG